MTNGEASWATPPMEETLRLLQARFTEEQLRGIPPKELIAADLATAGSGILAETIYIDFYPDDSAEQIEAAG